MAGTNAPWANSNRPRRPFPPTASRSTASSPFGTTTTWFRWTPRPARSAAWRHRPRFHPPRRLESDHALHPRARRQEPDLSHRPPGEQPVDDDELRSAAPGRGLAALAAAFAVAIPL